MGKRYMSMKEIAAQARRREGLGPILRRALQAWTEGVWIFIVLFVAAMGYIALRGGHDAQAVAESFGAAYETLPSGAQPESIPALALGMRDADLTGGPYE